MSSRLDVLCTVPDLYLAEASKMPVMAVSVKLSESQ